MPVIDLGKFENRVQAVESGLIWSAPMGAIKAALEDIKAGRIAPPATIPQEYQGMAREYGVTEASAPGLAEGTGPA